VGHAKADEAFDAAPDAPAACERWARAERLAAFAQVDDGWFALAPQDGQTPQDQQRAGANDPGPELFDAGVIEREPDPPNFRVGVGHSADGEHIGRFHASLGLPAPPTPRPTSSWPT
jgi:hypothetical protein